MFCKNCGIEVDENKKFCPNCGTMLTNDSKQEDIAVEEVNVTLEKEELLNSVVQKEGPNIVRDAPIPVENSGGPSLYYKGIVLCVGICSLIAIILVLKEFSFESYELYYKLMLTTAYVFIAGILNVGYSKLYETGRYKSLSVLGMCLSTAVFVAMLLQVWGVVNITSFEILKLIYSMLIISVAIFHASFILTIDYEEGLAKKIASAAKLLIVFTYGALVVNVFAKLSGEFYTKSFLIAAILTAFTTIAAPLLNRSE